MKTVRCLLAAMLFLVFGGGAALTASLNNDMKQPAVEVSMSKTMPGCDHCDDNGKAMTMPACSAFGTCLSGVMPSSEAAVQPAEAVSYFYSTYSMSGLQGSPDHAPPKSHILA